MSIRVKHLLKPQNVNYKKKPDMQVGSVFPFRECAPSTSGMTAICQTFIAKGVKKISNQHLEMSEVRIHLVEQDTIKELLENNSITEAVMQAPLWRYIANNI